jgi:hypothetical protein
MTCFGGGLTGVLTTTDYTDFDTEKNSDPVFIRVTGGL